MTRIAAIQMVSAPEVPLRVSCSEVPWIRSAAAGPAMLSATTSAPEATAFERVENIIGPHEAACGRTPTLGL